MERSPQLLLIHEPTAVARDYKDFFKVEGWDYQLAAVQEEGIVAAQKNNYEVIITDLDLSGISGADFISSIRAAKPNQAVVVVASDAKSKEGIRALKAGAIDFLQKPIDQRFLKEAIERIVGTLREEAQLVKLAQCLDGYSARYNFATADIGCCSFVPPLLNDLHHASIIDLNTKLKISLAFQEALTNSVEHGNLELPSVWKDEFDAAGNDKFSLIKTSRLADPRFANRRIIVNCQVEKDEIRLTINDEGPGFNAPKGDRLSSNNHDELLTYGRGLRILYGAMDRVIFDSDGTCVTLVKKIERRPNGTQV
jgi:FixJ family two-component response regulator/anti-sigma regulatory factor (Ser/Thr protein kinase)